MAVTDTLSSPLSIDSLHPVFNERVTSSEFITIQETIQGPDLPDPVNNHAMVAINDSFSMVIGGNCDCSPHMQTDNTFYYHHTEDVWANGPSLLDKRNSHAAGLITDKVTKETFVVVTGGNTGSYSLEITSASTEILQDGDWVLGKLKVLVFLNNTVEVACF